MKHYNGRKVIYVVEKKKERMKVGCLSGVGLLGALITGLLGFLFFPLWLVTICCVIVWIGTRK